MAAVVREERCVGLETAWMGMHHWTFSSLIDDSSMTYAGGWRQRGRRPTAGQPNSSSNNNNKVYDG